MNPSRLCLAVALHAALGGLWFLGASAAQEPAAEPPPAPDFPVLPAGAPAGTGLIQPCLESLEGSVRCGRFRVYEDREAGSGRTLDLAFVVADALDSAAATADAVAFFFGGPGAAVTEAAALVIEWQAELRRSRDLLLVDFRGVGNSGSLDCDVPYPGGIGSRFGALFPLDHVVACRDRLARRARLDLYTTQHNMDDLDELRAFLNYGALNLVGGSYGTREIQVYLRRHPESVRTVVMTGVSPLFEGGYVADARELQDALDAVVAECGRDPRCSAAYPELEATVERVFEKVRRNPPRVRAEGREVPFGLGELGYALRGLLYGRAEEVPALLDRAAQGEWQPLADYYLERTGWVTEAGGTGNAGMHFSVICAEDISRVDEETIARETAGTFLGDRLIGAYRDVCRVWPHAELPPSFWEPVASEVPALLLSGSRDPVTPPAGAEAVARHLPNSLHVVVPGAGHNFGGACIERIQRELIEGGTVEGLDTSCVEARQPPEFVLPDRPEARRERAGEVAPEQQPQARGMSRSRGASSSCYAAVDMRWLTSAGEAGTLPFRRRKQRAIMARPPLRETMEHFHEIRDPLHTFVRLDKDERLALDSRPVQRLRHIHQLALTPLVYPGATHKRFEHSLGVMELATRIFDSVMRQDKLDSYPRASSLPVGDQRQYWKRVLRMAALCHDIGHLPFSHAAEKELLPKGWDHERLTVELIRSDEMEAVWKSMRPSPQSQDIVKIAVGAKKAGSELTEWETILSEIIIGDAFGADRMDYLLRDSLHAGVAYGRFDHHRLIDTLRILPQATGGSQEPALGVEDGGLHSAEGLLLARYFMYTQVYFHPVRRIYDFHLQQFLQAWRGPGGLPTDPEEHILVTDHEVYAAMLEAARRPGAPGHIPARRIVKRDHFREIYRRNPRDVQLRPNAADLLAEALAGQFGQEAVHHDSYRETGGATDFPVLMPDGRIGSSRASSDVLGTLPVTAVDTLYVATELRGEANDWLNENRERILMVADEGGKIDGKT